MRHNMLMSEMPTQEHQVSKSEEVNTDSEENRVKRAVNHYNFELADLPHTFGKNFKDRFVSIRLSLFKGFPNISGEDHSTLLSEGRVLSDDRAQIHDEFMPSNEAAEAALEGYMPMVDRWYQEIQALPDGEDKDEATFRMLSAMFIGGVLIHPGRDGNGQTFKGLALSYMHDLLPHYGDKFIPIKYGRDTYTPEHEMAITFMGGRFLHEQNDLTAGAVPEIEPKTDKDKRVVDYINRAFEIQYRTPYIEEESFDDREKKIEVALSEMIDEAARELGMPEIAEKQIYRYAEEKRFLFLKKKVPVYLPQITSFSRGCLDYLRTQGYPSEQVQVTVYGPPGQKIDRASNAARQLMATEEGQRVLTEYVMTGSAHVGEEDSLTNELFRKAVRMISKQKDNIQKTLETKDDHDRRHQEMIDNTLS